MLIINCINHRNQYYVKKNNNYCLQAIFSGIYLRWTVVFVGMVDGVLNLKIKKNLYIKVDIYLRRRIE